MVSMFGMVLVVGFSVLLLLWWLHYCYLRWRKQKRYADRTISRLQTILELYQRERYQLWIELQDVVSGSMAAANFYMQTIEQQFAAVIGDVSILKTRQTILATSNEISVIVDNLSPPDLATLDLKGALEVSCDSIFQGRVNVEVQAHGVPGEIPAYVSLFLCHVAEQLLRYVSQHACAQEVIVMLGLESGSIALTIECDGIGICASQSDPSTIGLQFLKQMVADFQGVITFDYGPRKGTVVHMVIPL